jgi:hypothetical protein
LSRFRSFKEIRSRRQPFVIWKASESYRQGAVERVLIPQPGLTLNQSLDDRDILKFWTS